MVANNYYPSLASLLPVTKLPNGNTPLSLVCCQGIFVGWELKNLLSNQTTQPKFIYF
jgi:hypothetical protein